VAGVYSVKDVASADHILELDHRYAAEESGNHRWRVDRHGNGGSSGYPGLEVTVVEAMEHILPGALDEDIAMPVEKYLRKKGIILRVAKGLPNLKVKMEKLNELLPIRQQSIPM